MHSASQKNGKKKKEEISPNCNYDESDIMAPKIINNLEGTMVLSSAELEEGGWGARILWLISMQADIPRLRNEYTGFSLLCFCVCYLLLVITNE
jgi:hypothetical protein